MYKTVLTAAVLAIASVSAVAAPRTLVPADSKIEFVVEEMGVPVSGQFQRFDAALDIDPAKPEKSSAQLRIEIGSLTTGNDEADAIAVNADWLDKASAPYALFKSAAIRGLGAGRYEAKGTLSIRNKVRDLTLQFSSTDQADGKTIIVSDFIIHRSQFGIGGGVWNEPGVVAEDIPVKVRLTLAPPASRKSR